jgi:hypothetical protein
LQVREAVPLSPVVLGADGSGGGLLRVGEDMANRTRVNKYWTAVELRKLPYHERDAILKAAAALAEEDYRKNPELTAFEAFGKDDLYGESSSTETR